MNHKDDNLGSKLNNSTPLQTSVETNMYNAVTKSARQNYNYIVGSKDRQISCPRVEPERLSNKSYGFFDNINPKFQGRPFNVSEDTSNYSDSPPVETQDFRTLSQFHDLDSSIDTCATIDTDNNKSPPCVVAVREIEIDYRTNIRAMGNTKSCTYRHSVVDKTDFAYDQTEGLQSNDAIEENFESGWKELAGSQCLFSQDTPINMKHRKQTIKATNTQFEPMRYIPFDAPSLSQEKIQIQNAQPSMCNREQDVRMERIRTGVNESLETLRDNHGGESKVKNSDFQFNPVLEHQFKSASDFQLNPILPSELSSSSSTASSDSHARNINQKCTSSCGVIPGIMCKSSHDQNSKRCCTNTTVTGKQECHFLKDQTNINNLPLHSESPYATDNTTDSNNARASSLGKYRKERKDTPALSIATSSYRQSSNEAVLEENPYRLIDQQQKQPYPMFTQSHLSTNNGR